jgi:8-hydroxy-5-deazaflavin:NADPH oxidoreductase
MSDPLSILLARREFLVAAGSTAAFALLAASPFGALAQTAGATQMKIATIGSGREGGALGTAFAKAGHPVMFSSRHPEQLKDLVSAAGPNAKAGTVAEAVAFGDVVLLVVPYSAIEEIAREHGKALAQKPLVIDVSNPIPQRDGEELVKKVNEAGGAGLYAAKVIPGAKIVRAFNNFGSTNLAANAGDDKAAIALAEKLVREIGFEPVLIGGLAMGKYVVPTPPMRGEHSPEEIRKIAAELKA